MTETHYIVDILILLTGAVVAVPLFQRLGLGVVLGFLIAGATIGPWGFGFISAVDEIRHLAEFGVVFLLFVIGIELKPSRLWVMRRSVFGLGTAQRRIIDIVMPVIDGQLADDQGRFFIETIIHDLQQIPPLFILNGCQSPVIEDQQIGAGQLPQQLCPGAVGDPP